MQQQGKGATSTERAEERSLTGTVGVPDRNCN